jgi:hypothetical protein
MRGFKQSSVPPARAPREADPLAFAAEHDAPDPTIQVAVEEGIPIRTQYRLIREGELGSYIFAGHRVIVRASIKAYRQRQINKGPQLQPLFTDEKRGRGRPRKVKPEQSAAVSAE